ncbi:hypothetical protein CerSpe_219160 [Prunus speciosa]
MLWTFQGQHEDGTRAFGGYSDNMVVEERYAVLIPNGFALAGTAPLLCAGITVYSPLKHFGLSKPNTHLGVVGLGGLGHMAVKFAKAFGVKVTVVSSSPSKQKEAVERLGADSFLVSHDQEQLEAAMGTMDGIIDTVSAPHPLLPLIGLLKTSGKLILVGAPIEPPELPVFPIIMGRKLIAGSAMGGLKETQEMIDFAAKHNVTADVEVVPMDYVNTALDRLDKEISGAEEQAVKAYGWAARDSSGVLSPFHFTRRGNGDNDISMKILYCGICHSDLHLAKDEVGMTIYPIVPGHEIVGEVTKVGRNVTKFKVGDIAGVGCMVGSCRSCDNCTQDLENYCPKVVWTYNKHHEDGSRTFGGYSDKIVVDEHFVVQIPKNLPLQGTAPMLCAGITVYSPMRYFGLMEPGKHLGVVGLGGLGHMAVKFAKAVGAKVTVISTSPNKKKEAVEQLGVDEFLISHDQEQLQAAMGTMDGIIDTVSAAHPLLHLVGLLKTNGKLILVGAPIQPPELPVFPLILGRKLVAGSAVGGMKETQEMIDFAAKHNITADVEVIPMDYVNTALERVAKADVKYRFVIDVANTIKSPY